MNGKKFIDAVAAHGTLELVGFDEGGCFDTHAAVVRDIVREVKWALEFQEIAKNSWDQLAGVLTSARPAHNMIHMTRIVGYYSQVRNWNGSKLAELRDRQAHAENYRPKE